jgi:hypothetical protein
MGHKPVLLNLRQQSVIGRKRPGHRWELLEGMTMRKSKTFAIWAVAAMLAGAFGVQCASFAGEAQTTPQANLGALAGTAVPDVELGRQRGRFIANFPVAGELNNAVTGNNAFLGPTATGMFGVIGSTNNNVGITSTFPNSGINSVFQQTITP